MEAVIRFNIEDEDEFDKMVDVSILPGEIWELYNDKEEIIKFTEYETYNKSFA